MKILKNAPKFVAICTIIAATMIVSCTSSSTDPAIDPIVPPPATNLGALNLMAIDTAKVITMTEAGLSPITVLNRKLNNNSYISDFTIATDGSKFIYVEQQLSGVVPNLVKSVKLKIANSNGTNDTELFSAQNALQGSSISSIRYCSDGKIFFAYKMATATGNAFGWSYHTINADGSGDTTTAIALGEIQDVSNSRRFYIQNGAYPNLTNRTTIIDTSLDNGAGVLLQENFSATAIIGPGSFTNDGKYAVIPFKDANDIQVKIIDLATKAVVTKTIVAGLAAGWVAFRLNMASDSNRGVLTIMGQNYPKSKSYIFNATTGVTSTTFLNNDENVIDVYAF